jgi:hypothetical protein
VRKLSLEREESKEEREDSNKDRADREKEESGVKIEVETEDGYREDKGED